MTAQPIDRPFIFEWTGRDADALRITLRLTQDQMAEQMGCASRTVARWREVKNSRISTPIQEALDALYEQLTEKQVRRFLHALQHCAQPREAASPVVMAAEMTLMQARINELQQQLHAKEQQS
ncbi:hypothetical protein [Streptomyces canus]|uniref:hypothetical protein n=1 Tax=Streptomyces canus TaxID=58343 RepID=UPI00037B5EB6|nr:hypothetical protein [Streptomyces canus]